MWQNWINVILGLWIIAVPFLGLAGSTLMWSLVITGIAVAVLALWSAGVQAPDASNRRILQRQH